MSHLILTLIRRIRRFRARAKKANLVALEAQTLAKAVNVRDKRRAAEREAMIRNIIMKVLEYNSIPQKNGGQKNSYIFQIGNPKQWRTSNGDVIKVETMETRRAMELANAYIQLSAEYEDWEMDQQERIRNLQAVQASF